MPARSKKSSFAVAAAALLLLAAAPGAARADLSEEFGPYVATGQAFVPAGWTVTNLSSPVGITTWFQGNPPSAGGPFGSHQGAEHAYVAANFNSTTGSNGTISNWLITPRIETLTDGDEVSFFTRRAMAPVGGQVYPDRLELRLSTNDSCSPGATAGDVGDFATLLTTVNPNLTRDDWPTGYPANWTEVSAVLRGLPDGASGCIAFRYHVTSAGPSGSNSDYVGIDTFRFTEDVTPPPAPTLAAVSPAAPSNDPAPRLRGAAEAFSTVRIYGEETCTGPVLGSGSAADFADGGIPFAATADASTTPYATATDGSANVSPCSAAGPAYEHDGVAPETSDDLPAAWLGAAPAIALTASDGDGSGVVATHYEVGADPAVPTTASPLNEPASKPVLRDGERIRYFSIDAAGNEEAPRLSAPARVDTTAPQTSDDVTGATRPGDAVRLDASDGDGDGVAATHYEVGADPAAPTTASPVYDPAAKPVLADGERIRYFSVDAVGNAEAPRTSQAVVAPVVPRPGDGGSPGTPGGNGDGDGGAGLPGRNGDGDGDGGAGIPGGNGDSDGDGSPGGQPGSDGTDDPRGTGPAGTAPRLALVGRGLTATPKGLVAARLRCTPRGGVDTGRGGNGDATTAGRCTGTVRLTVTQRVAGRGGRRVRRVRVLARGRFTLRAAGTAKLRLKLTPAARRLLARAPRRALAVRLVVDARDAAGARTRVSFKRTLQRGR